MKDTFAICVADESDAQTISELINSVAHYFLADPSGAGAEGFLSSINQVAIAEYITNPSFRYVMGFKGINLAGVAALRDNQHFYHLFVHPDYQRQGVATHLCQHLQTTAIVKGNPGKFTVNSSLNAVPFYTRFGFQPNAEQQIKNGILFQPMQWLTGS